MREDIEQDDQGQADADDKKTLVVQGDTSDFYSPFNEGGQRELIGDKSCPAEEFQYANPQGKGGNDLRQRDSPDPQKDDPVGEETNKGYNANREKNGKD